MIVILKHLKVYGNTAEMSQILEWMNLNHFFFFYFLNYTNNAGIVDAKVVMPLK